MENKSETIKKFMELKQLYEAGVLTKEELESEKAKLIKPAPINVYTSTTPTETKPVVASLQPKTAVSVPKPADEPTPTPGTKPTNTDTKPVVKPVSINDVTEERQVPFSKEEQAEKKYLRGIIIFFVVLAVGIGLFIFWQLYDSKTEKTSSSQSSESELIMMTYTREKPFSSVLYSEPRKILCSTEYPVDGPEPLVTNIRTWMNDAFYKSMSHYIYSIESYQGALSDGEKMFDFYCDQFLDALFDDDTPPMGGGSMQTEFIITEKYVTVMMNDEFCPGIEPTYNHPCVTFRKSDGQPISTKQYFTRWDREVKSVLWKYLPGESLWTNMDGDIGVDRADFSEMNVCIKKDMIRIWIDGYNFCNEAIIEVPISTIEQYLSDEVLELSR